jgi:hypothetical protein
VKVTSNSHVWDEPEYGEYLSCLTASANQTGSHLLCRMDTGADAQAPGPRVGDVITIYGVEHWPREGQAVTSAPQRFVVRAITREGELLTVVVDPPIIPAGRQRTVTQLPINGARLFLNVHPPQVS